MYEYITSTINGFLRKINKSIDDYSSTEELLKEFCKYYINKEKEETIEYAMNILIKALEEDKKPGSYYYSWQSNISMKIYDNSKLSADESNKIAIKFLDYLIDQNKKECD